MSPRILSYYKAGMAKLWFLTYMNFTQVQLMHAFQARIMLFLQHRELVRLQEAREAAKVVGEKFYVQS